MRPVPRHSAGRARARAIIKQVCLEPRPLNLLFHYRPFLCAALKEGCDLDAGDRNGQLCQAPLDCLPARLHPHRKLEHQPGSATSTDHRFPPRRKGRSCTVAVERSKCPPDAPSQLCEGNITETGDELCLRARISGIDSGLACVTRLPRPSHTLPLAAVRCPHHTVPQAIELLASALVPS